MKSDFQVLLEQAKAEMENIRREEERQKAEKKGVICRRRTKCRIGTGLDFKVMKNHSTR